MEQTQQHIGMTEEKISELEHRSIEIIQSKKQEKNKSEKNNE